MALTLAITLDPARLAARIEVGGIPAGGDLLTIERLSPSGSIAGVRGAVGVDPTSSTFIVRDYELPLDTDLIYTATIAGQSVSAGFRIEWNQCNAWLVDLARPTNSLPLTIESMVQLSYQVPAGVHHVLDRRDPVVVSLLAWTPTTELVVLTETLDERDQVRNLLGSGYPFLVRTTPELGIGNAYFAASDFLQERFLTPGEAPERRWRITAVQIERPDPAIYVPLAPNTYANVKATYATYAAITAAALTYEQLAYTYPVGITDPLIPWPPDDV